MITENEQEVEVQDEQEPSLRDELEAAFEAADEPAAEEQPAQAEEPQAEEPAGPVRDEHGRFAPKQKAEGDDHGAASPEAGAQAGEEVPAPEASPAQPVAVEKAPQSWKPLAREHWNALPPDVRSEVQRREKEIAHTLQESAHARRAAEQFAETVRPFEAMIRAEGAEPLAAVASLLQSAAALRTAPPMMKAQMVANMVTQFGVPLEALDSALAAAMEGRAPQAMPVQQPPRDPRVDQLFAQLEQTQRQRQAQAVERATSEVETFGADKEFFEDVRQDMADLIEVAQRRGRELSLDAAYQQAIAVNPEIAKIVAQREAAKRAQRTPEATARARNAASSVRSSPMAPVNAGSSKGSLRADLEAAFEEASGS